MSREMSTLYVKRFCKYVSNEMSGKEKLLTDFIPWTECAFTTLDGLKISMFRFPQEEI